MPQSVREKMEQFATSNLIDFYTERYIYEYGEKKASEVINKVANSDKVKNLINQCLRLGVFPTSKDILSYLNTVPYFIFAKSETLCMGGLTVIILMQNIIRTDSEYTISWKRENTGLAINLISDCNNLKVNRADSFFSRFYSEMDSFNF